MNSPDLCYLQTEFAYTRTPSPIKRRVLLLTWLSNTVCDPNSFWAMIAAFGTIALALIAYWQLSDLAATSRSDFITRLSAAFFTAECRKLIFLIENELLSFRTAEIPYFEIPRFNEPEVKQRLADFGISRPTIGTNDIDDAVLGLLEDLGVLLKLKRVSFEEAYEYFSDYVETCGASAAIRDYIRWLRSHTEIEDYYDHFWMLYRRCLDEGERYRRRKIKGGHVSPIP